MQIPLNLTFEGLMQCKIQRRFYLFPIEKQLQAQLLSVAPFTNMV